jgi:hypothetical protein
VIAPPAKQGLRSIGDQREVFRRALEAAYTQGGWAVYFDELVYITEYLGLKADAELLWYQGRSLGVSVITSSQRPAYIPLLAYSMSTHMFFWRTNDQRDLRRIGEFGGVVDGRELANVVAQLPTYEDDNGDPAGGDLLYLNNLSGRLVQTRAPAA